jgi:hypothetical protein
MLISMLSAKIWSQKRFWVLKVEFKWKWSGADVIIFYVRSKYIFKFGMVRIRMSKLLSGLDDK